MNKINMSILRKAIGIPLLAILLLAGGVGAATEIDSCTTISSPGEYVLNTSIINSSAQSCINITASNVVFDGAGFTIDGQGTFSTTFITTGMSVFNSTTVLTNVTVKNLIVRDWNYGINYTSVSNGNITNNNASNNVDGIFLSSSHNNNLSSNSASNNNIGINLESSSSNKIYLNNFINNNDNVDSSSSTNNWNSTEKIAYTYNGNSYENYLGNYWSDYRGRDANGDGIGESPYVISRNPPQRDNYPLVKPFENYIV